MILLNPYVYANRNGIPRLEANSVNVGTTNVTFTFIPHNFLNKAYSGLILFKALSIIFKFVLAIVVNSPFIGFVTFIVLNSSYAS